MSLTDHVTANGDVYKLIDPNKLFASTYHPVTRVEFGDEHLVPRADWKQLIDNIGVSWQHAYLPPVADQSNIGMCNCSATASALEMARLQAGLEHVQLSGGDLYRRISGGQDNGSTPEDGLAEAKIGIAPTSVVPYLDWKHNYPDAIEARKKYRVLEWVVYPTFDHYMSGAFKGFTNISGILWYDNYTPGQDGWIPRKSGRYGGHAFLTYKPTYRIVNGQIQYGMWSQNSWTERYGLTGRFVCPEYAYDGDIGGWWGVRGVVQESGNLPQPT